MPDYSEFILEIIKENFGEIKTHNSNSGQLAIDCPVCSYDIKGLDKLDGRGNLEINYKKHVYRCWSCGSSHGTKGHLHKLFKRFVSPLELKQYKLFIPEEHEIIRKSSPIKLPYDFKTLNKLSDNYPPKKRALNYLKQKRGLSDKQISDSLIGISEYGKYLNRIILPYFVNGRLIYYMGRDLTGKAKNKYETPSGILKDTFLLNEDIIDWTSDLYLVEGGFDAIYNQKQSIILLGKYINDYTFDLIYEKAQGTIYICLDGDAYHDILIAFKKLNGGRLYNRIKIVDFPLDLDMGDLRGDISSLKVFDTDEEYINYKEK